MAGSSARLNELLDLIKVEFESAGVEGSQWKLQRDEYEGKSGSLFELYRFHSSIPIYLASM